jgi:hypothetical protein
MTYATDESTKRSLEQFQSFDADTQLGLLWFGYLDLKDKLTPANETSTQDTAAAVFDQFVALSKEEQLQAQRDIVNRANTDLSRAYSALASSGKLDLWLRLAQGMEDGRIIGVPSDYEPPAQTNEFVEQIKQLEFEQRLNFMRSAVVEMGAK